jgi:tryptophanyl-tRNA synthetase
VPVGEDQLPHLELTREIARRFNHHFGSFFPEPEALVTEFGRFPGTDGRRMSKSLGNTLELAASPEEIRTSLKTAYTDPQRLRRSDPGNPDVCAIYTYYQKFLPEEAEATAQECRTAARGCVDCKQRLAEGAIAYFDPLRERRAGYASDDARVDEIVAAGCARARAKARETMERIHEAMQVG